MYTVNQYIIEIIRYCINFQTSSSMSILQTILHRDYGHRKKIKAVFNAHAIGHHGLYNKDNLRTDKFEDCESHALNYYDLPLASIPA